LTVNEREVYIVQDFTITTSKVLLLLSINQLKKRKYVIY
jgi:hypothetical protein